jgi:hypothetical protein
MAQIFCVDDKVVTALSKSAKNPPCTESKSFVLLEGKKMNICGSDSDNVKDTKEAVTNMISDYTLMYKQILINNSINDRQRMEGIATSRGFTAKRESDTGAMCKKDEIYAVAKRLFLPAGFIDNYFPLVRTREIPPIPSLELLNKNRKLLSPRARRKPTLLNNGPSVTLHRYMSKKNT